MTVPPEAPRQRLKKLIDRLNGFIPADVAARGGAKITIPAFEQWRFLTSTIQTVKNACGEGSPHLRELEDCRRKFLEPSSFGPNALDLDRCRGVLEAAHDDLVEGMLSDMRQLVAAETFGDVLEGAAYLLDQPVRGNSRAASLVLSRRAIYGMRRARSVRDDLPRHA